MTNSGIECGIEVGQSKLGVIYGRGSSHFQAGFQPSRRKKTIRLIRGCRHTAPNMAAGNLSGRSRCSAHPDLVNILVKNLLITVAFHTPLSIVRSSLEKETTEVRLIIISHVAFFVIGLKSNCIQTDWTSHPATALCPQWNYGC